MRSRNLFVAAALLFATASAVAQAPATSAKPSEKPQVRVNYLNVCSPSAEDQRQLSDVLGRIALHPIFGVDMEISRGRSTVNPSDLVVNTGQPEATQQSSPVSRWVRIRHDFPEKSPITTAQYSLSVTEDRVAETLVFYFKDDKEVMQMAINDTVDSASDPAQVARLNTPADRIRIERFGKSSIVLARCPSADQSRYEPVFRAATGVLDAYRRALGVPTTVPSELARLGTRTAHPSKKPSVQPK